MWALQISILGDSIVNPTTVDAGTAVHFVLKTFFVLGYLLYTIFAFIAVRQIQVMSKTLATPFSRTLLAIGLIHLLIAVGLLLAVFLI